MAKIVPYPSQAANVKIINDSIPDLVAKNQTAGKHVTMADCFTGFTTSSMQSSDSIHPQPDRVQFHGRPVLFGGLELPPLIWRADSAARCVGLARRAGRRQRCAARRDITATEFR